MRPKIAFIGAGSLGFTRGLVRDMLTFPLMRESTIALMDINKERLAWSKKMVDRIVQMGNYPAKVIATTDRKEALKGANGVLCTILSGDVNVWRHDIEIPKKYGIDTCVGDTRSVSGIFRALRTIPVMVSICKDIERYCPDALFLNYTNPMAMLCRAMQKTTKVQVSGLCHSVQGTAIMLATWAGATMDRITYVCAGINHQAWFVEFKKDGKDAYPLIRKALKNQKIYEEEVIRNEMFLHLDYYVTESSGHNSEYNWWFRKRPDLIKKYCRGTGWNPGEYAYILKAYKNIKHTWKKGVRDWLKQKEPISLQRGGEYAANIFNAYLGGEKYTFNGNVPNTGIIPNLPQNACVEVPVFADKRGLNPMYVGHLPPQCAALNNVSIAVEEMAVESALTGDARLVFHAVLYDPLTAAVLSMAEIKKMVSEMLIKNKDYLPQFKNIKI